MKKRLIVLLLMLVLSSARYVEATGLVFSNATDCGSGWKQSAWFGHFYDISPWVYHSEHGWLYVVGNSSTNVYMWSAYGGWWWTAQTVYPFFYSFDEQSWLFYYEGTKDPRGFYNFSTRQLEFDHDPGIGGIDDFGI